MAGENEERKDQTTDSTDVEQEGGDSGTETKGLDELLKENPSYEEEFAKRIQAEADRRVTQALQKKEAEMKRREEEARAHAAKEAKEARLLEDEKYKELAELRAKEAQEARAELERLQNERKVEALLEKREVHDPTLREVFKKSNLELEQLDEVITKTQKAIAAQVDKVVNERLGESGRPPQTSKDGSTLSLQEQIRKAEASGDWATSMALKNEVMDQLHQQFSGSRRVAQPDIEGGGSIPSLESMTK